MVFTFKASEFIIFSFVSNGLVGLVIGLVFIIHFVFSRALISPDCLIFMRPFSLQFYSIPENCDGAPKTLMRDLLLKSSFSLCIAAAFSDKNRRSSL